MKIVCKLRETKKRAVLTTESSASSYGQPVLVIDSLPHGYGDTFKGRPLLIDGPLKFQDFIVEWNRRVDASHGGV